MCVRKGNGDYSLELCQSAYHVKEFFPAYVDGCGHSRLTVEQSGHTILHFFTLFHTFWPLGPHSFDLYARGRDLIHTFLHSRSPLDTHIQ